MARSVKPKWFKIHPFGVKCYLLTDIDEFNEFVLRNTSDKTFEPIKPEDAQGLTSEVPTKKGWLIAMAIAPKHYNDLSVLVHESVHAAIKVMDGCGVPVNEENQETIAYLTDFIFQNSQKYYSTISTSVQAAK